VVVGLSLDVERLLNYCRDGAYNSDRRNGVRKAHGQKNVDRGYPLFAANANVVPPFRAAHGSFYIFC
jgi:hypothetical protein